MCIVLLTIHYSQTKTIYILITINTNEINLKQEPVFLYRAKVLKISSSQGIKNRDIQFT